MKKKEVVITIIIIIILVLIALTEPGIGGGCFGNSDSKKTYLSYAVAGISSILADYIKEKKDIPHINKDLIGYINKKGYLDDKIIDYTNTKNPDILYLGKPILSSLIQDNSRDFQNNMISIRWLKSDIRIVYNIKKIDKKVIYYVYTIDKDNNTICSCKHYGFFNREIRYIFETYPSFLYLEKKLFNLTPILSILY